MVSKATTTLLVIDLLGTKSICVGEMISGRIPLSMLAINFTIILYKTLHNAIWPVVLHGNWIVIFGNQYKHNLGKFCWEFLALHPIPASSMALLSSRIVERT
jgi:hypothetical protein